MINNNKGKLERKLILSMAVIFMIIFVSTSVTIFVGFLEESIEDQKERLLYYSDTVAAHFLEPFDNDELSQIPEEERNNEILNGIESCGEYIDNWIENGIDEHYVLNYRRIIRDREKYNLSDVFAYKVKRNEKGDLINEMTIIFDTPDGDGSVSELGDTFGPSQAFDTVKAVYETGVPQVFDRTAFNSSGFVIVAYAPLKYKDGTVCAVVGAEDSLGNLILLVFKKYYFLIIVAVANFFIFAVVVYLFIRKSVVQPVGIISRHMNKFVSNEGSLEYEPITEIFTRDEIEQIADDFNSLATRTIDYTRNLAAKSTEEERLRVDLDVASQIRKVVSSETAYPAFPERRDFDLCASLRHTTYNKCSFCNYFFTDTNRLIIVIGESLGNSLASMIFSVLSVSYIKCFAKMGFEPAKIASETNNQLCSIEKKDSGLTVGAIIAEIDLKSGTMKYVNAGMPPMLIKKPGENFVLAKADLPFSLGQMRGVSFEQNTVQLYQGSTVLLTSFGVSEMGDPDGNKYGFEKLIDVMNRITGSVYDLDKTIAELESDLEKFRSDSPTAFDTAILGFRYFG